MGGFKFIAALMFFFGFVLHFLITDVASVLDSDSIIVQTFATFDFLIALKLTLMIFVSAFLGWLARG